MKPDADIFIAQVRALQSIYGDAHRALVNWGAWSRDLRRVFPPGVVVSPTWRESKSDGMGDGYAEEGEGLTTAAMQVEHAEAKAEGREREPYDEKSAHELDRRLHEPGGLPYEIRLCIRTAYVSREIPEDQFPRLSGCNHDAFRERLEYALRFAGRFIR